MLEPLQNTRIARSQHLIHAIGYYDMLSEQDFQQLVAKKAPSAHTSVDWKRLKELMTRVDPPVIQAWRHTVGFDQA